MAITEKYVSASGSGDFSGSDASNEMRWAELTAAMAGGSATAGYRYNIKSGSYAASYNAWTNDGSAASPIILRGYHTTIGDLDTQVRTGGNGALDLTNFPVITIAQTDYINASGASNIILQNLSIVGAGTGTSTYIWLMGSGSFAIRCKFDNPSTNASAMAVEHGSVGALIDCDLALSGGSGGRTTALLSLGAHAINCRIVQCPAVGITISSGGSIVRGSVIANCGGHGIEFTAGTAGYNFVANGNTIYGCGGDGINLNDVGYTTPFIFIDNHITDCTGYAIQCDHYGTDDIPAICINNRTRGNTAGQYRGLTDWRINLGEVTSGSGASSDFTNAGANDFTLISAAPGKAAGLLPYMDIGALQRQEAAGGAGGVIGNNMDGGFA